MIIVYEKPDTPIAAFESLSDYFKWAFKAVLEGSFKISDIINFITKEVNNEWEV